MTDEGPLHTRQQRAQQAKELLSHPLLKEAFNGIRQTYLEAAMSVGHTDDIGRFRVVQAALVVDRVKGHLQHWIEDGKLAEAELRELQRGNDRKKYFGVV